MKLGRIVYIYIGGS